MLDDLHKVNLFSLRMRCDRPDLESWIGYAVVAICLALSSWCCITGDRHETDGQNEDQRWHLIVGVTTYDKSNDWVRQEVAEIIARASEMKN